MSQRPQVAAAPLVPFIARCAENEYRLPQPADAHRQPTIHKHTITILLSTSLLHARQFVRSALNITAGGAAGLSDRLDAADLVRREPTDRPPRRPCGRARPGREGRRACLAYIGPD